MRVFVSEFVTGGGWPDDSLPPISLWHEGRAMLLAVMDDLRLAGHAPVCTWDSRWSSPPDSLASESVRLVHSPGDEADIFAELVQHTAATLIIAPETHGILSERCERVLELGGVSWNCSPKSIRLMGDKLATAEHLSQHLGTNCTVPTMTVADWLRSGEAVSNHVLKPRHGCGSWLTFLLQTEREFERSLAECHGEGLTNNELVMQPFVAGQAISLAGLFDAQGRLKVVTPVGEQSLSNDGRFAYLGGRIPAAIPDEESQAATAMFVAACGTFTGLVGWVGCDLIFAEGGPLIVDLNPRFTTSYCGYRRLATGNLLTGFPDTAASITWRTHETIRFEADGDGTCEPRAAITDHRDLALVLRRWRATGKFQEDFHGSLEGFLNWALNLPPRTMPSEWWCDGVLTFEPRWDNETTITISGIAVWAIGTRMGQYIAPFEVDFLFQSVHIDRIASFQVRFGVQDSHGELLRLGYGSCQARLEEARPKTLYDWFIARKIEA